MRRRTWLRMAMLAPFTVPVSRWARAQGGGGNGRPLAWEAPPDSAYRSIAVGDLKRTYLLYEPATPVPAGGRPLIFVLHGGGGQGRSMWSFAGMNPIADREGALVVYPDAEARVWNVGQVSARFRPDDVAFFGALLAAIPGAYNINPRRVYAAGISNGGMMVQRLACELTRQFAAVASIAGTLPAALGESARPDGPLSVLVMHGTADPLVPYGGGRVMGAYGAVISAADTVRFWVAHNGCSTVPTVTGLPHLNPEDITRTQLRTYAGGQDGSKVAFYTIQNGGHTWPGKLQYLPADIIGPVSRDFDGSEAMWRFFDSSRNRVQGA